MTAEELNWLLQTIEDTADAERLVLAQYERGKISFQLMADVTRRRDRVNRTNQSAIARTRSLTEYAKTEFPIAIA